MQTVFDNSGVAHAWARGASEARSNNGNFYSSGRKLYSYGSHFVVGVRLGVACFALNTDNYSISTSRHKSEASYATHGERHYLPALTEIADTLAYIAEADNRFSVAPSRSGYQKRVREYLTKHASALDDSEGAWLASFAKLRGKAWEKAKRERERLDAAKAKADARAKRKAELSEAIRLADADDSTWREHVRNVASDWRGEEGIATLATKLRRARIVAKREGLSAKRLNAIRAKLRQLETLDSVKAARIASAQKERRSAIASIRRWTGATPEARAAYSASQLNNLAYSVRRLGGLVPYMAERLESFHAELSEEAKRREAIEFAERERQRELERIERERSEAERRALWLAGEGGRYGLRLSDESGGALVRAVNVERDASGAIIGGTLETGHGADVPLAHAVKAFRFVKLLRQRGETWQRNGRTVRVGHYQIDSVDSDGFTAGCHRINWPEIERLARELGVYDAPPCDAREPSAHAA